LTDSEISLELEDIRDEFEKINPINLLTSNKILDEVQIHDSSV